MPEEVVATLKPGENLIAASCRNRAHGGLLDFGLAVEKEGQRSFVQIARQLSVEIQPMQTLYKFACGPVNLDLTFTAPLFMDDLELMARPVNYISYTVASTDGQSMLSNFILRLLRNGRWTLPDNLLRQKAL